MINPPLVYINSSSIKHPPAPYTHITWVLCILRVTRSLRITLYLILDGRMMDLRLGLPNRTYADWVLVWGTHRSNHSYQSQRHPHKRKFSYCFRSWRRCASSQDLYVISSQYTSCTLRATSSSIVSKPVCFLLLRISVNRTLIPKTFQRQASANGRRPVIPFQVLVKPFIWPHKTGVLYYDIYYVILPYLREFMYITII